MMSVLWFQDRFSFFYYSVYIGVLIKLKMQNEQSAFFLCSPQFIHFEAVLLLKVNAA